MHVVVLAGGGGTRLWPISKQNFPKQFLSLDGGPSLLQKTLLRFSKTSLVKTLTVSTQTQYRALIHLQLKKIKMSPHIIEEPCKRNTAPAIALAIRHLETFCNASPSDLVLVLPSDHLIDPETVFLDSLQKLQKTAQKKVMITFGIHPTRPESEYGYIQIGDSYDHSTYLAKRFIEKPSMEKAKELLKSPTYYWNTGMFLFSIETFWRELSLHTSEVFHLAKNEFKTLLRSFEQMPDLSIDYGLMEKTKNLVVCPLPVSWSDVGSWDSLYDVLEKDPHQNVKIGNVFDIDTKNCMIVGKKKLISTLGLEDLIIVETKEALFITKKGEAAKMKSLVQELTKKGL